MSGVWRLVTDVRRLASGSPNFLSMIAIFGSAALVCAFLLFWVEPLFARLVLPLLGGAPAVWNTCLMFFQALLLLGYLYAHASSRFLSLRRQVFLHIALLALAFIVLPVAIPRGWTPPAQGNSVAWLVSVLTVSLGLPFLVLSATAPLLQRWLAGFDVPVKNPYILYAASNAGSFLGLLAFPLILEPRLRLGAQSRLWMLVFITASLLVALCGWISMRRTSTQRDLGATDAPSIPWRDRLTWLALAFVPSSLLLSVTTFLSTDIAATPLLWVIPLSLYLLTFVIVFAQSGTWITTPAATLHTALIFALAYVVFRDVSLGFRYGYLFHLVLFTVTALVLHGELAATRPPAARLTEYYLWISLGGALGGVFTAIVVPQIFRSTRDYTLMLVIGCLLRVVFRKKNAAQLIPLVIVPAILLAAAALSNRERATIYSGRSFFGIYRVARTRGPAHVLYHGSTIHGAQLRESPRTPVTYYHRNGPVGQIFASLQQDEPNRHVGIVGLGTGSVLCYARPGENWTFFEIDPRMVGIAKQPRLFSFLSTCGVKPRIVLGDARLTIAREPAGKYSLLVLDAFSSDAIPVHLMTREAFRLYSDALNERGVLFVHISNRRLDLEPVVSALAEDAALVAMIRNHNVPKTSSDEFEYGSDWVVMTKRRDYIAPLLKDKNWRALEPADRNSLWTDDYSNLFSVIRW